MSKSPFHGKLFFFSSYRFSVVLVLISSLLLTACQQTEPSGEIRFVIAQAPINLDPRYATDAASERVNRLLYQPLVDFDAAGKPVPKLAGWIKLNSQAYQFTLKDNQPAFHNGSPLTAADVRATYQSLLQLKSSPHAAEFSNIAAIETLDEKTIIFKLKQADAHFAEKLIIGILPTRLIQAGHDFNRRPIGNGPLAFVSWNNALRLKRVKDRQMISLQEVKDPTVRVLKLIRGEADLLQGDLPPELVKYLQSKSELKVKNVAGANFSYLGLNMQDPVLKELKVRQAIAYAIDRQAIIDKVMVSDTRIASAILPPEHYTNAGLKPLPQYGYNPALAKKLLQKAGVKLPLKLAYKTSTDAQRVRFATILQAQMQPAGIDLQINSLDWGTFFESVKQGNFQMYGLTWVGIKTPDIYAKAFGSNFVPPNGFNRGRYADTELDALLAREDWPAATQRIYQQLPYIPLWYEGQFAAMHKEISGYAPKADGNWDDLADVRRN